MLIVLPTMIDAGVTWNEVMVSVGGWLTVSGVIPEALYPEASVTFTCGKKVPLTVGVHTKWVVSEDVQPFGKAV